MSMVTLELRPREEQTAFNLRRWEEVLADPELRKIEGRVETDRHGRIVLVPPQPVRHGELMADIGSLLAKRLPDGRVVVVCPVSTRDGVRAIDVAWVSDESWCELADGPFFLKAPEICVEVVLPSNPPGETSEKMGLYFDAGAREVWTCDEGGRICFYQPGPAVADRSKIGPEFPQQI